MCVCVCQSVPVVYGGRCSCICSTAGHLKTKPIESLCSSVTEQHWSRLRAMLGRPVGPGDHLLADNSPAACVPCNRTARDWVSSVVFIVASGSLLPA